MQGNAPRYWRGEPPAIRTTTSNGTVVAINGRREGIEAQASAFLAEQGETDKTLLTGVNWDDALDSYLEPKLLNDYLMIYGGLDQAVDAYRKNEAMLQEPHNLGHSYAQALQPRVTDPEVWERRGTADGREYRHTDTVCYLVDDFGHLHYDRTIEGGQTQSRKAAKRGGQASAAKRRKYATNAERQKAYRERRKAAERAEQLQQEERDKAAQRRKAGILTPDLMT